MKGKKKSRGKRLTLPKGYKSRLDLMKTEKVIKYVKDFFQDNFSRELNLSRVSAPIVVLRKTGINDYLTGVERPVDFHVKATNEKGEIVQSLAKWKRLALADYGFTFGEGLYTDMNAIRPDENLDNLHSVYVDQWDWEIVIHKDERNVEFLKRVIKKIYKVVRKTEIAVCKKNKKIGRPFLPEKIYFIHSEELEKRFPDMSPEEREDTICRERGAVFIMGIGADLADGRPHDDRAADYDDWITETGKGRRGLNGDILVWYPTLDRAVELSSMGIRVNAKSLIKQLKEKKELRKRKLFYHQKLLNGKLPLTIGGGIGQSRLCMLFLKKAHIGEVQSSIWPEEMIKSCRRHNIHLL